MARVLVGMSGGVDSSVAAALLVEQGHDVVGAYMKNWTLDVPGARCPWADDLAFAKRTAVRLGIDFRVYDFQEAYKREVVDYLVEEYRAGRTPNPDVMCNQEVKFGLFLDAALDEGFDYIATGHYARVGYAEERDWSARRGGESAADDPSGTPRSAVAGPAVLTNGGRADAYAESDGTQGPCADLGAGQSPLGSAAGLAHSPASVSLTSFGEPRTLYSTCKSEGLGTHKSLLMAADTHKDQTYFLYRMTQRAVDHTLFPLGEYTKPQVRAMAEERGLPSAAKPDSQGICFVGEAGIREFLRMYVSLEPGEIVDADTGAVLGHHDGAIFFTLGQRKGLNLGGGPVRYVVGKDMERNIVYVSENPRAAQLAADEVRLARCSWIAGELPAAGECLVRCRHTGALVPAELSYPVDVTGATGESRQTECIVRFDGPREKVAPGQSVVVYRGQTCLGGGISA